MSDEKTEGQQLKEFELAARALAAQIADLTPGASRELQRIRQVLSRYRRLLIAVIAALVLALGGGIALGVVAIRQHHQEYQVEQIQHRLARRASVLCPLYTVFLQADTPASRKATPPGQRAARDNAFRVIRQGYATLECSPHLMSNGQLPPGPGPVPSTK